MVTPLIDHLQAVDGVNDLVPAGSYRRGKETAGDIDLLVTCDRPKTVMEQFVTFEDVDSVIAHGSTKSSGTAGRPRRDRSGRRGKTAGTGESYGYKRRPT
ncbi:MAG: hypothetical protein K9L66_06220 [Spirochaetaceae bacterium]|nr:hypothetical protein [Spirochaetaceae bacterium]MCF7938863.1 hypothetical protein [Spirochaetales bacterium]